MNLKNGYISFFFAASTSALLGCAHTPVEDNIKSENLLQSRLEATERNNGRLRVRVEDLEDQIFLLQDRVDSNRIALQRRGVWGQKTQQARNDAPAPAPESYRQKYGKRTQNRFVHISAEAKKNDALYEYYEEGKGSGSEDVVITENEYNDFIKKNGYETTIPQKRKNSKGATLGKRRTPQPNVTNEKLLTTRQLNATKGTPPKKVLSKRGLALYKQSLAFYRSGNYDEALKGFEAFLAAGPKDDYIDNALYWIGECHFGLGAHAKAASFFQRVLREQPDGNKIPDSMLKMALAYDKLGKTKEAKRVLKSVSEQYPKTNAGKLGAQKLSEL